MSECKRSCCWNPWGTCPNHYQCACHPRTPEQAADEAYMARQAEHQTRLTINATHAGGK